MSSNQYKRANKVVFPVLIVIMGYIVLSLGAYILKGSADWQTYVQVVASVVGIVVCVVLFLTKRDTRLCAVGMLGAAFAAYIAIRLVGHMEDSYSYAFPMLFAAMVYLDKKIILACDCAMLGVNIVRVFLNAQLLAGDGGVSMTFYKCESLKNVTIPYSVTAIGDRAFSNCKSLQSVTIPYSVTTIGDRAFSNCKSLQSVTMPDSVTSIGMNPFHGCVNVKIFLSSNSSFRVINNLLISANNALISCLSNSANVTIPDFVTAIGKGAFYGCASLQSVTLPESVASIGKYAFPKSCKVIKRDDKNRQTIL